MPNGVAVLAVFTALLVSACVLGATYVIADTPGALINESLVGRQQVAPAASRTPVGYQLEEGKSAKDIGKDLEALGVIRSGEQFQLLVGLMGLGSKLSAGEYDLPLGISAATAVQVLTVKGAVPTIRITFPEGIRIEEMAEISERSGFATRREFIEAVSKATLPAELGALPQGQTLQGYLFPDTYILPIGSPPAALVELMLKTFVRRFNADLRAAVEARGLTVHQAVTLASIIEREAVLAEERPLMAAVFYNRMAAGDLLGADPTVQYAVSLSPGSVQAFGWWKKNLTLDDLKLDSPFNTRLKPGIPPGPIANPGLASLEAVANPADSKMYYFVADAKKGDGSHVFAETLEEHNRNQATVGQP
ncbi:MAG: endolytic transglycosylase MltG [Dehalococcoidia bacterium]